MVFNRDEKIANEIIKPKDELIQKLYKENRSLHEELSKQEKLVDIATDYENKDLFFESTNFSLKELYNALTYIEPFKDSLQHHIYEHIQEQYKPNNECVFYDVTNYYFEIVYLSCICQVKNGPFYN